MNKFHDLWNLRIIIEVDRPLELGATPAGKRRFVHISGGTVSGALSGKVLPGGTDWQTMREDGSLEIEAHYLLQLEDGALVEVYSTGIRSNGTTATDTYFRTSIRFNTGSNRHQYLNNQIFMSSGKKIGASVHIDVNPFA